MMRSQCGPQNRKKLANAFQKSKAAAVLPELALALLWNLATYLTKLKTGCPWSIAGQSQYVNARRRACNPAWLEASITRADPSNLTH